MGIQSWSITKGQWFLTLKEWASRGHKRFPDEYLVCSKDSHTGATEEEKWKRIYDSENIDSMVCTLDEQYVLTPLKKNS